MEKKDPDQPSNQSNINNSVNSYGPNYGILGHTVTVNKADSKAQEGETPANPVEKAIWKGNVVELFTDVTQSI